MITVPKNQEAEVAYLTGIYESSGYTVYTAKITKKEGKIYSKAKLILELKLPHIELAKKFQEFAGGGAIYGPLTNDGIDEVWHYRLTKSKKIVDVMIAMEPWLLQYKKASFDYAYEKYLLVKSEDGLRS